MIKNAHNPYALQFIGLGDNPSKKDLLRVLNAIHAAIRDGELRSDNCDEKIVEKMQQVIIYTLIEGKNFSFYRDLYFSPVPNKVQSSKGKTKVKAKPKTKTKTKACGQRNK